jgi:hypothetical protein
VASFFGLHMHLEIPQSIQFSDGTAQMGACGIGIVTAGEDDETGSLRFIWLYISLASVLFLVHILRWLLLSDTANIIPFVDEL